MSKRKPQKTGADLRGHLEFALSLGAGTSATTLVFVFAWLEHGAPRGWLNDFGRAVAGELVAVAVVYVLAYVVLLRRGLRREDDVAAAVLSALDAREGTQPAGLLGFHHHPKTIDWHELLSAASELVVAGRWFSAWSSEHFDELKAFFVAGGRARVYLLAPDNGAALAAAARQHSGFVGTEERD